MSVIEHTLQAMLADLNANTRINIAFSGGIDSTVLLYAVSQLCNTSKRSIRAIHINHQLHADAQEWEQHCMRQCERLGIDYLSVNVDITPHRANGIEGAARQVRYQAFMNTLDENDVLLMAHHADDQIETVLLQLFRGTGLHGLAGCAPSRQLGAAKLIRPFIHISRQEIEEYANEKALSWLEDPSNNSTVHDRNYLRHKVIPMLHSRWEGLRDVIGRTSQWQKESIEIMESVAVEDIGSHIVGASLPLTQVATLGDARLKNVLRWWIRANGFLVPSAEVQQRIVQDVVRSRGDCEACIQWQGCEIRKYRDNMFIQTQLSSHDPSVHFEWEVNQPLYLPSLNMTLTRENLSQAGLILNGINSLQVRFRVGGEVIKPRGRGCSKELKTLFQEAGVAPWLRSRIPLIFNQDELIYVWDYWIGEGY